MTARYLIDENLPSKINVWKTDGFIHVTEINVAMDDFDIWTYALENKLTIVTKDGDFRNMIIADKSNLASSNNKLVIVYNGFIETF